MADSEEWRKALHANKDEAKAFTATQWREATPAYKPPPNANLMPGGTEHTAGGKAVEVTLSDAARTIKSEDWQVFHKKPCVKDSLLVGIGSGAAMGSIRAIWRAPLMTACNWAVGTFCLGSFFMYQYCNYQRYAEKEGMRRALEIIDRKAVERKQKEARLERARELRRQKKEEEQQHMYANLRDGVDTGSNKTRSSWKFW